MSACAISFKESPTAFCNTRISFSASCFSSREIFSRGILFSSSEEIKICIKSRNTSNSLFSEASFFSILDIISSNFSELS